MKSLIQILADISIGIYFIWVAVQLCLLIYFENTLIHKQNFWPFRPLHFEQIQQAADGTMITINRIPISSYDVTEFNLGTAGYNIHTFLFKGANRITLTDGTPYIIMFNFAEDGLALRIHNDNSSPKHDGNLISQSGSTLSWSSYSTNDLVFHAHGTITLSKSFSGTLNAAGALSKKPKKVLTGELISKGKCVDVYTENNYNSDIYDNCN